jgi:hypothetical protein
MSKDFPYSITYNEDFKRDIDRVNALMDFDDSRKGWCFSMKLGLLAAEAYVKGDTETVFVKPSVRKFIKENPRFLEALLEEGVVEWLTPFVIRGPQSATVPESSTDPHG